MQANGKLGLLHWDPTHSNNAASARAHGDGAGTGLLVQPEIHELVVVNRHIVSVVSLPDWRHESLREGAKSAITAEDPSPKIQPEAQSPNTELRLLRLNSTPEL